MQDNRKREHRLVLGREEGYLSSYANSFAHFAPLRQLKGKRDNGGRVEAVKGGGAHALHACRARVKTAVRSGRGLPSTTSVIFLVLAYAFNTITLAA